MQNADYNTYNYYCMILPRLKATVDRIPKNEKEIEVVDAKYDEDDERAEKKIIDLSECQDNWQVEVCSPQGLKWPQDEVDIWKITEITSEVKEIER